MTPVLRAGLLLLLVAACNRGPRPTHRGLYVGGTANVLTTCGDAKVYWIQASAAMNKMLNAGGHMVGGAGRPVFVELRARVIPAQSGAVYAGTLQVDTVLGVSGRQPSDCSLPKGAKSLGQTEDP